MRPRCRVGGDGRDVEAADPLPRPLRPQAVRGDVRRLGAGISEKVLIQQLRDLVAAGVLIRHDYQKVPPMVDYSMTPFGMTLVRALMPLCEWGNTHRVQVEEIMRARSSIPEARVG